MKRKWLAIPITTGLLAVGLTGASALAHNEDGETETPRETVAGKVAEILGIDDEQAVKDAIQQATQEVRLERLEHRLGHMVEAGVLTQEQADEYLAWYEARPEGSNLHRKGHRILRFGGSEGDQTGPRQGFGQGQFRGLGSGGGEFRGQGELRSRFSERFEGREFPGEVDLRSMFSERFGGDGQFPPGLGGEIPSQVPSDLPDEIPEGNGASF